MRDLILQAFELIPGSGRSRLLMVGDQPCIVTVVLAIDPMKATPTPLEGAAPLLVAVQPSTESETPVQYHFLQHGHESAPCVTPSADFANELTDTLQALIDA